MKIGIILGSIREGRNGEAVAKWVQQAADARGTADYQTIDLKSFNVPLLTSATVPAAAGKQYDSAEAQAWSAAIDACDAFVFVTPEYNHSLPGAFKNAVDTLGAEWEGKAIGFVSYGSDAGIRVVEAWRSVVANFQMTDVRAQVALSLFTDFGADGFAPQDMRAAALTTLFDQVEAATAKLRD